LFCRRYTFATLPTSFKFLLNSLVAPYGPDQFYCAPFFPHHYASPPPSTGTQASSVPPRGHPCKLHTHRAILRNMSWRGVLGSAAHNDPHPWPLFSFFLPSLLQVLLRSLVCAYVLRAYFKPPLRNPIFFLSFTPRRLWPLRSSLWGLKRMDAAASASR
jgi:hypothetical protein